MESTINDELVQKAEALDSEPKITEPRKRGRPKKENTQATSQDKAKESFASQIPTKVLCYPIVKVISVSGEMAVKDKRAAMQPAEAEVMAESLAMVFDKHLPALLGNYGAEIALLTAMGQYSARLYMLSQQIKREQAQAKTHNPESTKVVTEIKPEPSIFSSSEAVM